MSYFLITHDMDVIHAMAHEVMVMQQGAVIEHGSAAEVLGAPRHPYTRALIEAAGLLPQQQVQAA